MNLIADCIKFIVFAFLLMAFMGHIISNQNPVKEQVVDERKEVFMEDCLSVSYNTKRDCEIIFKQLTKE